MKKLISIILILIMIGAIAPVGLAASALQQERTGKVSEAPINPKALRTDERETAVNTPDPDEIVTLIIKLKDAPVAARMKDVNSTRAGEMTAVLKGKQSRVQNRIRTMLPQNAGMEITFSYTLLFNGFSAKLPYGMMAKIAELPEVEKVFVAPVYAAPELLKTEEEKLSTSVGFIDADDAWNAGYTGKGTVIAIVDTGCVVDHVAFSTAPEDQKIGTNYLSGVITNNNMQAEQRYTDGELTADTVYYSGKIPFRFNYDNGSTDVSHSYTMNDHGSHVAGIAAGYYSGSEYTGVAKDAQLAIMQVFSRDNGGASFDTILAALEDCAYLEVDAVNLSLGVDLGFTSESDEIDAIFDLMAVHGINIASAAGNSGSAGKQYYGSNFAYSLAMNPDNGLISAPSTYRQSLAVACCMKTGSAIAYLSSHGTTSDLKLKPEVSAPGYTIYAPVDSQFDGTTTEYGPKSGTSMSSPHVAGAMALLSNYVSATWPSLSGQDKADMVNRLLMCTAKPVSNTSPRAQGSGIINLNNAVTTKAYITVDNCSRPKLELGDDPEKTGVYTLSFNIVNFGTTALSFTPAVTVLTDNATTATINGQSTYKISTSPRNISSSCTISGNSAVTVPANSTRTVTITVTLNSSIRAELDSKFPNGAFVEGNVVLDGTVDLVVPFLAFYGNWSKASVFDRNTYIDEIQGVNNYNIHTLQTQIGSVTEGDSYMLFGANPYIETNDWWADRCTLSPNGDNYYERIDKVLYALIRNAKTGGLKIYNEDDPETEYFFKDLANMPKSWKYSTGEFSYASDWLEFDGWGPTGLAEGTHVVFKLYHYLDFEGFDTTENECCEIVLPMTVDNTAPQVTYWKVGDGTLKVNVHDEHYAAWIGVYSDAACTNLINEQAITEHQRGTTTQLTFDIGDLSTVYVKVGDYGRNTSEAITLTGEGGDGTPIDIVSMTLDPAEVSLFVGNTAELTAVKVPSDANNFEISWSSSNPAVASVSGDNNGCTVTAEAIGTATVTATATNLTTRETVTAECAVTVNSFVGYVRTDSVELGEKYIIIAESSISGASGCAVGNTAVTGNHFLNPVVVTITDEDMIVRDSSTDFDAITWIPAGNAQDGYTWQNVGNNKYLGLDSTQTLCPSSNPVAWLYDSNSAFNNQIDNSGYFYLSYKKASGSNPERYLTTNKNGAIRLYKLVEPNQYTVSFVDWDGTVLKTETVEEGRSATAPADPLREGWTFTGWDVDFTNVTSDLTVTAQYSINTFTVTFVDWDGTVLKTETVDYGASATAPADPKREGWTFTGWDVDFTHVTSDLTVTAQYRENTLEPTLLGDINCDGTVDVTDALLALRYTMGTVSSLTEQGVVNGDMNSDGTVDSTDAILIMRQVMGAK